MVGPLVKKTSGPAGKVRNLSLSLLRAAWTMVPGVVTAVDKVACRCNVKIKIRDDTREFAELTNVPVVFPRGGNSIILMPLTTGDVVLVGFSKFPLDSLLVNEQVVQKDIDKLDYFDVGSAIVLAGFVLDNELGETILDDAKFEIPTDDIVVCAEGEVKLGSILKLLNLGADPASPEDGMLWRNGNAIWARSEGSSSKWAGGGGTGSLPTYNQATEPTIGTNSQAIWRNSATGQVWLVVRITAATQYKVELS